MTRIPKRIVEWRFVLTHSPPPPERKFTKTYPGTMDKCIEKLERFDAEYEDRCKTVPYWRDMTAKIETRETTPWRTYHHVKEEA